MPAAKAIRELLTQAAAVTAIVPASGIYPVRFEQGAALPALVITRVSTTQLPYLDAASQVRVSRDRIQVAALAGTYPQITELMRAVDLACTYERGVIAGVTVYTITRERVGPDLLSDDRRTYERQVDFLVTYEEPTA